MDTTKCIVKCIPVKLNKNEIEQDDLDTFVEQLSEVEKKLYTGVTGPTDNTINILKQLEGLNIKQVEMGPDYMAFLVDDGYVCRVVFQTEKCFLKKAAPSDPPDSKKDMFCPVDERIRNKLTGQKLKMSSSSAAAQMRLIRAASSRAIRIGGSSRPSNAPVPEELIEQAQAILAGKPRPQIIRELQRCGNDVNMAVNNLLGRDDDEDDNEEEHIVHCDDLMSFLDAGAFVSSGEGSSRVITIDAGSDIPDNLLLSPTNLLSRSVHRRKAPVAGIPTSSDRSSQSSASKRDSVEQRLSDLSSRTPKDNYESSGKKKADVKETESSLETSFHNNLQWWMDSDGNRIKFKAIASMYSELVGIKLGCGSLCQWKWSEVEPYRDENNKNIFHPLAKNLRLVGKHICMVDASSVRASVVTSDGCLATWVDESISPHCSEVLNVPATCYDSMRHESIVKLNVCSMFSAVLCKSNVIYWWGIFPNHQRNKVMQNSSRHTDSNKNSSLSVGDVCYVKSKCLFKKGAIALNLNDKIGPMVGRLCEDVEEKDNKQAFSFEIYSQGMSSTSEGTWSTVSEKWNLDQCDFIKHNNTPTLGTVKMVDKSHNMVLVDFSSEPDASDPFKHLKMMSEHEVFKHVNHGCNHGAEHIKHEPERVKLSPSTNFLALDANDSDGINSIVDIMVKNKIKLGTKNLDFSNSKNSAFRLFPKSFKQLYAPMEAAPELAINDGDVRSYPFEHQVITRSLIPVAGPCFVQNKLIPSNIAIDANGLLYSVQDDDKSGVKESKYFDLPPVIAFNMQVQNGYINSNSKKMLMGVFVFKHQYMMPLIMKKDIESVEVMLQNFDRDYDANDRSSEICEDLILTITREKMGGNRNILHMCASVSTPHTNKECRKDELDRFHEHSKKKGDKRKNLDDFEEIMSKRKSGGASTTNKRFQERDLDRNQQRQSVNSNNPPINLMNLFEGRDPDYSGFFSSMGGFPAPPSAGGNNIGDSDMRPKKRIANSKNYSEEVKQKKALPGSRNDALKILKSICNSTAFKKDYIFAMLSQRDISGYTPFMYALSLHNFPAASILLDCALDQMSQLPEEEALKAFRLMIYPEDHHNKDDNPLHMLCSNDVCSFTWTGKNHIKQVIFECQTCGLTETLCCCSECVRVCHKGHVVTQKKNPPTAYCDCWEKCCCKSLVAGDQKQREKLLESLIKHTRLYEQANENGNHILTFLVETLTRQAKEHAQMPLTFSSKYKLQSEMLRSKLPDRMLDDFNEISEGEPEHDLKPPRFCETALNKLLRSSQVVSSLFEFNKSKSGNEPHNCSSLVQEDLILLQKQSDVYHVERFVNSLIMFEKGSDYVNQLCATLVRMVNDRKEGEGVSYARQFVRSAIRVYASLQGQTRPEKFKDPLQGCKQRCRNIFMALLPLAACELAEVATALITPVRMGVTVPSQDFHDKNVKLSEAVDFNKSLFGSPPLTLNLHSNDDDNDGDDDDDFPDKPKPHETSHRVRTTTEQTEDQQRDAGSMYMEEDLLQGMQYYDENDNFEEDEMNSGLFNYDDSRYAIEDAPLAESSHRQDKKPSSRPGSPPKRDEADQGPRSDRQIVVDDESSAEEEDRSSDEEEEENDVRGGERRTFVKIQSDDEGSEVSFQEDNDRRRSNDSYYEALERNSNDQDRLKERQQPPKELRWSLGNTDELTKRFASVRNEILNKKKEQPQSQQSNRNSLSVFADFNRFSK